MEGLGEGVAVAVVKCARELMERVPERFVARGEMLLEVEVLQVNEEAGAEEHHKHYADDPLRYQLQDELADFELGVLAHGLLGGHVSRVKCQSHGCVTCTV